MPRTKNTRNPFGTILPKKITLGGRKVTVYDARKRYTDENGKRCEKYKRCYTLAEAQTALLNFPAEIAADSSASAEETAPPTFLDLTKYYRKNYLIEAVFVRDRQIAGYRSDIKTLGRQIDDFEEFFGDVPLSKINYETVRQYSIKLSTAPKKHQNATEPPAQATVNRKLALLRKIFNVGVQLEWRAVNPMNQGKPLIIPRAERPRSRILTFEEEKRLLAACTGDQWVEYTRGEKSVTANAGPVRDHLRPIIIMAIDTGMRVGEILNLVRSQIDFDAKTITLRARQTKALRARAIPLSERLEEELTKLFKERFVAANAPVFGGLKSVDKSFNSATAAAGIEDFTFHDLRHTATTWFDEAGLTESVKKNIIGHSDGGVHERYNNLSADVLRSARKKIDDFRRQIDEELKARDAADKSRKKPA